MLAQNFKTANDLGISEAQKGALCKVLTLLETGKLKFFEFNAPKFRVDLHAPFTGHFNMAYWQREMSCGTVGCIAGTAEMIGGVSFGDYSDYPALVELFQPCGFDLHKLTAEQASIALRSFLTTGEARWDLAVTIG